MPTELYNADNPFDVAFSFDADINWGETHTYEITKRKVEGKGAIADYIASTPIKATVEGVVTAMTVDPAPVQPQKLVTYKDDLFQLGDKKQPVLVLSELYDGYLGIASIQITKSLEDGQIIRARIAFENIETTQTATATVPAAKLKAKVKRRKGGKKGGGAKGSKPKEKDKTLTLRAAQSLGYRG